MQSVGLWFVYTSNHCESAWLRQIISSEQIIWSVRLSSFWWCGAKAKNWHSSPLFPGHIGPAGALEACSEYIEGKLSDQLSIHTGPVYFIIVCVTLPHEGTEFVCLE